jgi:hypothetical protein
MYLKRLIVAAFLRVHKPCPTTIMLCVTSRYLYSVTSSAFIAPLFDWLLLSHLKLNLYGSHITIIESTKLQGFLRSTMACQFKSLQQPSLFSLPPHKPRVCHTAVNDSVNYHVKTVYIFLKSKRRDMNRDKQAHWYHTGLLRSDFRKGGLKPDWYPP